MQTLPHVYTIRATGAVNGNLRLSVQGVPDLMCNAPAEFDGPGDQWSPESLLVAAVASCFVLTFRAVSHASKLEWFAPGMHQSWNVGAQLAGAEVQPHRHTCSSDGTDLDQHRVLSASPGEGRAGLPVTNSLRVERELKLEILTR